MAERRSRLQKNEQKKAILRIITAFCLLVIIISVGVYYFPNIILGVVSFNNRFLEAKKRIENEKPKDTIAPFPPKILPLPKYVSQNSIDIEGTAEKNSTVKLYRNGGFLLETGADSDGNFVFEGISLPEETNKFYTIAVDSAGNESKKSDTQIVYLKKDSPTLEVSTEVNNEEEKVIISGKTQKDVVLTINGRRVVVGRTGNFKSTFPLQEEENKFNISATDPAGNETKKELIVKREKEST